MPRTILRRMAAAMACGAMLAPGPAAADEPPPRVPPTAAMPTHHPISRRDAPARDSSRGGAASGGFWLGTAGIAAALAAFGAVSLGAKRLRPGSDAGPLKVIARASLSPRHSVYLLRAGDRVLILGAGGQGPPSLLGELAGTDGDSRPPSLDRRAGGAS